jgi:hypothetical protein
MARIFLNNKFLSLSQNSMTLSRSSQQKRTEKKENEVKYKNVCSSNLRD